MRSPAQLRGVGSIHTLAISKEDRVSVRSTALREWWTLSTGAALSRGAARTAYRSPLVPASAGSSARCMATSRKCLRRRLQPSRRWSMILHRVRQQRQRRWIKNEAETGRQKCEQPIDGGFKRRVGRATDMKRGAVALFQLCFCLRLT